MFTSNQHTKLYGDCLTKGISIMCFFCCSLCLVLPAYTASEYIYFYIHMLQRLFCTLVWFKFDESIKYIHSIAQCVAEIPLGMKILSVNTRRQRRPSKYSSERKFSHKTSLINLIVVCMDENSSQLIRNKWVRDEWSDMVFLNGRKLLVFNVFQLFLSAAR